MTTAQYQNLTPREAADASSPRLFSFARIREGATVRFYPGAGAKLHFANRDVDTLEMPGVPSGFLAPGDVVTASYRGACVFRGDVATIVELRGRGTDSTQTVTCVGPWSKMQRLVYRQSWFTGGGSSYSSRLILNQTQNGAPQNLNSELLEIASHGATACGYSVASGDIRVSTQVLPTDECRDITVADAIKRELRFFPKAVCRFDYSQPTPKLMILGGSREVSTAAYVADVPKSSREYVYNAHPITGVDLEIEASGTIEGVEYHQISHQTAGDTAAGNPDCLYATLQIKGASASTTKQSFESVTENFLTRYSTAEWWKEKHPRLANVALNAITIADARRTGTLPRISAATAGELKEAGLQCEVSKFTCKATIETTDDKEEEIYLTLNFLTTNAEGTAEKPKTYTWNTGGSSESGETVPTGLAATILAERAGALLSEKMTVRLGDALPTLGDAIVEADGTVFLQQVDVDCGDLTAELTFGVPEYLTPEDMASLLSGFRNKCTTSSSTFRKTGKTEDSGNTVKMGGIPPLSSSEFAPGTKSKTTIKDSSGGGSIKLDSTEVGSGEEIAVREITVKGEDGEEKTVKVLASDTFDPGDGSGGVTSLNDLTGDVTIIGGKGIRIEKDGNVLKIVWDEEKEEEDELPTDPCRHPEGEPVPADDGGGHGGISGGVAGGVPAGGDAHAGDGCTSEECEPNQ